MSTAAGSFPTSAAEPAAAEQRLGVLSADRPCAGCGFNLHGATIIREPHYRLVCARCPECGTVAALQEYPTIAAWAGRIRILLAAALIAVSLLVILVTSLITWGLSEGVSQDVCSRYATIINEALNNHQKALYPDTANPRYLTSTEVQDWWKALPPAEFLERSGGLVGVSNWWGLLSFSFIFPLFFSIGVFWSVLFPRARAWRLLVLLLVPIGLATLFYSAERYSSSFNTYYYFGSGHILASMQIGWVSAAMTMVFCLLALACGTLLGRRVARWMVQTLLPPRLATAFSYLWLVDGRPVPRA
ncbi:MAG: hypothetical protein ACK4WH_06650 [Phycisphaerales bacterium]